MNIWTGEDLSPLPYTLSTFREALMISCWLLLFKYRTWKHSLHVEDAIIQNNVLINPPLFLPQPLHMYGSPRLALRLSPQRELPLIFCASAFSCFLCNDRHICAHKHKLFTLLWSYYSHCISVIFFSLDSLSLGIFFFVKLSACHSFVMAFHDVDET